MGVLHDRHNRRIDYLRISVTDRCNLRCLYCTPSGKTKPWGRGEVLSYEEIKRFVEAAVGAGISKVRLTGGEPLIRKDLAKLVGMFSALPGLRDISITTNGLLLPECGSALKAAGLKRVNISIDSLDPKVYQSLTCFGSLGRALAGMKKAFDLGFDPIKINAVLIRGINDDPKDFVKLLFTYPVHVRFIELMPVGHWNPNLYISIDEFKAKLTHYGSLTPVEGPQGAGPASYVSLKGALGTIGFINPISNHFCRNCNRLRLTSDGKLRACLFSDNELNIRQKLTENAGDKEIVASIQAVLNTKLAKHNINKEAKTEKLMSQIGG